MAALVFDIGGTHLRCALSDSSGALKRVEKRRIKNFAQGYDSEVIWSDIVGAIVDFEAGAKSDLPAESPIVVAFPGPIAHPSMILDAPTVLGLAGVVPDLRHELTQLTRRQVHIINDLSAAAWYLSRVIPDNRFIVVTVSSGIGSKVCDKQNPLSVLDDVPYAGEIGHATVDFSPVAPACDCGGKGHLGAISSGRGIERFARRYALEDDSGFDTSECAVKYGADAHSLTNEEHLVPAATHHDEWAIRVISKCTVPLARTLLPVVLCAGLEKVVIIGGFALALGQVYLDILRRIVTDSCDYRLMRNVSDQFILGDFSEEACLEGAAVFAALSANRR